MVNIIDILEKSVLYGEFTLSSGKDSDYYIDKYKFETDPKALDIIGEAISEKVEKIGPEKLGGVALGAVPLVAISSVKSDIPYVIIRKQKKEYGTGKSIEGELKKGEKILVIEDVITTGNSALDAVKTLRNHGATVKDIIVVVDRQEGGKEKLEKEKLKVHRLVKAEEILKDS